MADIARDIRLAVDTGKVAFGMNEVMRTITGATSKLVVVAKQGKKDVIDDILHACKVADLKVLAMDMSSMDLGTVCGKPFSLNAISILEPGNSTILEDKNEEVVEEKEETKEVENNKE